MLDVSGSRLGVFLDIQYSASSQHTDSLIFSPNEEIDRFMQYVGLACGATLNDHSRYNADGRFAKET
jgi:hypothetical protein